MNGNDRLREQAICLAALCQAAALVDELARHGKAPEADQQALMRGLFCFEWERIEDVYGGVDRLGRGIALFEALLELHGGEGSGEILRLILAMLQVAKRLSRERLAAIRARLQQLLAGNPDPASVGADSLDALYREQVSTLDTRIHVQGSALLLQDPAIAARIRTLLLCGLRAAVLWRHCGGTRTALLLRRGQLLRACRALVAGN